MHLSANYSFYILYASEMNNGLYLFADISLASPLVNSLSFVITGLTGKCLGEEFGGAGEKYCVLLMLTKI